jgi:TonB family protein
MREVVTLSIMCVFLLACASNNKVEVVVEEPIQYLDLTLDDNNQLINEYWVIEKRIEPKYPISAARKGLSGCVDLIVSINSDGTSGDYKIRKSFPEGVFDKYATDALNNWQWVAADKNSDKTPVLTTVQLDFMVSGTNNKTEAENHCGYSHVRYL